MASRTHQVDQAQALLYHARAATPFFSDDGEACASLPTSIDSRRVVALRSAVFRDWLIANFYSEFEEAPSSGALRAALQTLESQARYGGMPAQRVAVRVGFEGDPYAPSKVILDLANEAGEVVEITSQGWVIGNNLKYAFRQTSETLALARPVTGSLTVAARLAELLGLGARARTRILIWLVAALRPVGPYPVLVLNGPSGSGKSFLARVLRALLDPSRIPIQQMPKRPRGLLQLAACNRVLVFDPCHRIPEVARPMILVATTGERPDRTLIVDLTYIESPQAEAKLWTEFERLRPALTATLCNAVATALARIRDIDLGNVARFADSAAWVAAAAPAIGLEERTVVAEFAAPDSSRRDAVSGP